MKQSSATSSVIKIMSAAQAKEYGLIDEVIAHRE